MRTVGRLLSTANCQRRTRKIHSKQRHATFHALINEILYKQSTNGALSISVEQDVSS